MDPAWAARRLATWFGRNGRDLPWRKRSTPYHVLVAEFILQQTRMETGLRYYARFLRRFPTLRALARAREVSVLRLWSGLGYYARARNLHRAARRILDEFGGRVPSDPDVLRTLPGIGPYTAGAISSIAYDRPEPALDGNQVRVLGRLLGIRDPEAAPTRRRIEAWSGRLLREASPRILNQAIMDLGSAVCVPQAPRCAACPLAAGCRTRPRLGARPRRARVRKPVEDWEAIVHARDGCVWLRPPHEAGLLAHLWLPPLRPAPARIRRPDLVHEFSHRTWRLRWRPTPGAPKGAGRWVGRRGLTQLPHGSLTRKFVEAALSGDAAVRPRRLRGRPRPRGVDS